MLVAGRLHCLPDSVNGLAYKAGGAEMGRFSVPSSLSLVVYGQASKSYQEVRYDTATERSNL